MDVCQFLNTYRAHGLEVCNLNSINVISVPHVYTKDIIPVSHDNIPTDARIREWDHLDGVILPQIKADISLMILTMSQTSKPRFLMSGTLIFSHNLSQNLEYASFMWYLNSK